MSTIAKPERRRFTGPALRIVIAAVLIVLAAGTFAYQQFTARPVDPLQGAATVRVAPATLTLGITATGAVEPQVSADLALSGAGGRVSELLVATGDRVAQDAALLVLDTRQLSAELAAAEAAVAVAEADLLALQEGATAEQVAVAQAQIAAAQGSLVQTQASVTAADVAAARASLEEARAALAVLEAGPRTEERTRAETALQQARANLERQRSILSAAKLNADAIVEQRANAVRAAQDAYSAAYWDYEHVKAYGTDPRTRRALSDIETRDYANALAAAERNLADAERALDQSRVDAETARRNEVTGLADAEAQVARAQADLDALLAGADSDELAAARARVARAQADLARVTGGQQAGAIAAQQGNLAAAQARLAELQADPRASDLARAEARLAQAKAQREQVQVRIADATLRAPFAGVVAAVNVAPGEIVGAQDRPITLIDDSRYLIKVTVDEVDIGRVRVGQPVEVLIDALGGAPLSGTVQTIAARPQPDSAVTAYEVTVAIDAEAGTLMPGMTATATIVADRRADVLAVPAEALREEAGRTLVDVVTTAPDGTRTLTPREVEVGLRVGSQVEIISGLTAGEEVVVR
jgi:RND family efflux transporter MFP subunit